MDNKAIVGLIFVCVFSGCGIWAGNTTPVPEIPPVEMLGDGLSRVPGSVALALVQDSRDEVALIPDSENGEKIYPDGDVEARVRAAVISSLKRRNLENSKGSALQLEVFVGKWRADILSDPSRRVKAQSQLRVVLSDSSHKSIFEGTYFGEASRETPFMTRSEINEVLAFSMGEAIQQFSDDGKFQAKVRE